MATLDKRANDTHCPGSPAEFTPQDIAVAFLVQRFRELSPEALRDIVSLMQLATSPDISEDDFRETIETVREILFPELIGDVQRVDVVPMERAPHRLRRRAEHIGKTIQKMRTEKGWTQTELAERSGLQQSHISRLEAGAHSPSWKTLEKIAGVLGVDVGQLDPSN
jgi:DNA-binding XRE family transcriptional regulator